MYTEYQCEYCLSKHTDKEYMEGHEKECEHNPDNKTCYSCSNEDYDHIGDYCPHGGHETVWNCKEWE